jgi:hypothetical protein
LEIAKSRHFQISSTLFGCLKKKYSQAPENKATAHKSSKPCLLNFWKSSILPPNGLTPPAFRHHLKRLFFCTIHPTLGCGTAFERIISNKDFAFFERNAVLFVSIKIDRL